MRKCDSYRQTKCWCWQNKSHRFPETVVLRGGRNHYAIWLFATLVQVISITKLALRWQFGVLICEKHNFGSRSRIYRIAQSSGKNNRSNWNDWSQRVINQSLHQTCSSIRRLTYDWTHQSGWNCQHRPCASVGISLSVTVLYLQSIGFLRHFLGKYLAR